MRKIAILTAAAGVAAALGSAAPASAAPAQCYDAYGRPVGPQYDTRSPNYNWINSVHARGGSCRQVGYRQPGVGLYFQFGDRDHRGRYDRGYDYNRDYRRHRREYNYRREPGGWKYDTEQEYERNKKPNAPQQRYEISR